MPYPDQELNAIDVVMQFAIHGLNFPVENIILFGWSIGGYATSWAAMNYPDVNLVVSELSFMKCYNHRFFFCIGHFDVSLFLTLPSFVSYQGS